MYVFGLDFILTNQKYPISISNKHDFFLSKSKTDFRQYLEKRIIFHPYNLVSNITLSFK